MAGYSKETIIKTSPEAVFGYVSDMPKHSEWASHDLTVTSTSEGAPGVGSTFASVGHQFGVQRETQSVTEYEPGRRFAFESRGKLGLARHSFDLEAGPDGSTRLTKSMSLVKPSLMARFTLPMIGRQTSAGLEEDLRRIKAKLEA